MNRRDFTKVVGFGAMAAHSLPLLAFDSGSIPLGLCNHSLRDMKLNARQLIEYAIEKKLDSVLLNTFQPFDSLEKSHLSGPGVAYFIGIITQKKAHAIE